MTLRVVLQIVDLNLDRTSSRFWSAVLDRDPITTDQILLSDIFSAWSGQVHPIRTRREDARKRREAAAKRARIAAREKKWRRHRNNFR
ncbi:hypothetical protein NYP18_09210 [Corynebacterium sp. YIM 101645]|uniref:Uncharacterized protein n=1 Tax=Corynebacterium lemuris TaxID=1859292 RepID=A0ABT2FX61_9CORY|nr:hypothetical protein [Corynebacterium lemuris]MCS5479837.1 hypothetical protein [Corynebacterium lemuris]